MAGKDKLRAAYEDAKLETELPPRFTGKPGSLDTPIARTARKNMLESAMGVQNSGKNPDKYIGYANQEAREAAAEERRETGRAHPSMAEEKGPSKQAMQEAADAAMRRREERAPTTRSTMGETFKKGGKVSSASKRADGCAVRGKTKGRVL